MNDKSSRGPGRACRGRSPGHYWTKRGHAGRYVPGVPVSKSPRTRTRTRIPGRTAWADSKEPLEINDFQGFFASNFRASYQNRTDDLLITSETLYRLS